MLRIESNAESVLLNLQRSVLLAEANMEMHLRRAAMDAMALIVDRIQQQGFKRRPEAAGNESHPAVGAYSKAHAKRRAERGRQIEQVDLTNEGDLMRSFNVLTATPKQANVGFLSDEQADIAGYLEDYYGPTFYLSDGEQDQVVEGLMDSVMNDLMR